MVSGLDLLTTSAAAMPPLHQRHHHLHQQQHSLTVGVQDSTSLLIQEHRRKLQMQQQEINLHQQEILLLQTQVLQKKLEELQQTNHQLKKELAGQQQVQMHMSGGGGGGVLLQPSPAGLLPTTPALLITATQSAAFPLTNPTLEVARLNIFATPPPDIGMILARTRAQLTACGWYHGCLSWQESDMLLERTEPGTFLVRDSQNPGCMYSLSVQRGPALGGPTSIRVQFHGGRFALDAESDDIRRLMPAFDSVGDLVDFYVDLSRRETDSSMAAAAGKQHLKSDSSSQHQQLHQQQQAPILLSRPLYHQPPSLAHLCRLAVNRSLAAGGGRKTGPAADWSGRVEELSLPPKLASYLASYTLSI
jgi:hypothetical protein